MKRIKTGVPGLDDLIESGIPEGMIVAVVGGPGTGKTILCTQFLNQGIEEGERCLYLTFDGTRVEKSIKEQAMQFGMDLGRKGLCDIHSLQPNQADDILKVIKNTLKQKEYKRMVIDSISMLNTYQERGEMLATRSLEDQMEYQQYQTKKTRLTINDIRELGITTLFTVEDYEGSPQADKVAEFAADGVIKMTAVEQMKVRYLAIKKMRETKIEINTHEFNFTEKGIVVKK